MWKECIKKEYSGKSIASYLYVLCTTFYFIVPSALFAQNFFPCKGPDCTFENLVTVAQEVANWIIKLGLMLSPLIFAYAGFLYLTSGANPGQRTKASGIFKNVAIGLVIMMCAWLFVSLILNALLDPTVLGNLPWAKTN
jgi:hypothetical protein